MKAWVLTRYADIAATLGDSRLSSSLGDLVPEAGGAPGSSSEGWKVLEGLLDMRHLVTVPVSLG